jgi:GH43 family beta-xylosidase
MNPLIEKRADPLIYRHNDGYYYFTASVPEYDRIELRRSETINGLSEAKTVDIWHKHETGEMSCLIWAPELHYIKDKWYIYFAAGHTMEVLDHRVYVLECGSDNPLTGEWIERGRVDTGEDKFALDATTFVYEGRQYLVWAQQETDELGHSSIFIAPMKNPWTLETTPAILSRPEYEWERRLFAVNEGPAVIVRNGKVFITYSASGVDENYCMGMLWCDLEQDFLNAANWNKATEPVFKTSYENEQYGPGHNSFTVAEDGKTDLLVYHARDYAKIIGDPLFDPNRHTRVKPFGWDDSGMPDFGVPPRNND